MIGLLLAMLVTADGMVMNANDDVLPRGCEAISRDYEFHIEGGRSQASQPGMIRAMISGFIRARQTVGRVASNVCSP